MYDVYGASGEEEALIDQLLDLLANESGLSIERVEHMRQANLRIYFYRPEQRQRFLALLKDVADEHGFAGGPRVDVGQKFAQTEQWPCIAFLTNYPDGAISHAAIYVHAGLTQKSAERCISLTHLQIMGFPRNRIDISSSILGSSDSAVKLTQMDYALIRMLYSEQMHPGTGRVEVQNALNNIHE